MSSKSESLTRVRDADTSVTAVAVPSAGVMLSLMSRVVADVIKARNVLDKLKYSPAVATV